MHLSARSIIRFIISFVLLHPYITFAQVKRSLQNPALSVGYAAYDFQSISSIKLTGFKTAFKNNLVAKPKTMLSAVCLGYEEGISNRIDGSIEAIGSTFLYPVRSNSIETKTAFYLEVTALTKFKLVQKEGRRFVPFLLTGISTAKFKEYFLLHLPIGVGLKLNVSNDVFINLTSQFRYGLIRTANNHMFAAIAVGGVIGKKKYRERVRLEPSVHKDVIREVIDTDSDGISDAEDLCPLIKGLLKFQGCPDNDEDGIQDSEDSCSRTFGIEKYGGCPIPDSDKDGVNDEEDSCISVAGSMLHSGCPESDRDSDGIEDRLDVCPEAAGTSENHGCPQKIDSLAITINKLAAQIQFKTNSYELTPKSKIQISNIVQLIKPDLSVQLSIEAHTDSNGDSLSNMQLSENRLETVMKQFSIFGFPRTKMTGTAKGENRPISTNTTSAGRQRNRRVEIVVQY